MESTTRRLQGWHVSISIFQYHPCSGILEMTRNMQGLAIAHVWSKSAGGVSGTNLISIQYFNTAVKTNRLENVQACS